MGHSPQTHTETFPAVHCSIGAVNKHKVHLANESLEHKYLSSNCSNKKSNTFYQHNCHNIWRLPIFTYNLWASLGHHKICLLLMKWKENAAPGILFFTCFRKPTPNARVTFNLPFTRSLEMMSWSLGCSALNL
jgi:hypothetical protein